MAESNKRASKILLVVSSYPPNLGGLQSITSRLAVELERRGHVVKVLTQRYPRSLPSVEEIENISVRRMLFLTPRLRDLERRRADLFLASLFYFPFTLIRVLWLILREKPRVVNLHFVGAPTFFLVIAHALLRFRFVVSLHGDDVEGLPRGTWFDRWVFRATLRRADAVTACSRYLLDRAQTIEPIIAGKGRVIHNGTDLVRDVAATTASCPILAIGRLVPKKGFDVLLHALAKCDPLAGKSNLTLIGDGPERSVLEKLAYQLRLDGRVTFCGAQNYETVVRVIATSRVVVIPSRQEPFGLVALEAMAAGKPVVATRVGGLPEVLDGADALLVEPDNPTALARAMSSALVRLEREPQFGARNREIAARFSVEQMVENYESLYSQ